jgi:hypothetical protein
MSAAERRSRSAIALAYLDWLCELPSESVKLIDPAQIACAVENVLPSSSSVETPHQPSVD